MCVVERERGGGEGERVRVRRIGERKPHENSVLRLRHAERAELSQDRKKLSVSQVCLPNVAFSGEKSFGNPHGVQKRAADVKNGHKDKPAQGP